MADDEENQGSAIAKGAEATFDKVVDTTKAALGCAMVAVGLDDPTDDE